MPQTIKYANVLTRIGVQRAALLNEAKLKSLAEASDLEDFVAQLRDTSYQTRLQKAAAPFDSRQLERIFKETFLDLAIKITKNAPNSVKPFLMVYLKRFEVDNLKALIKASYANFDAEQTLEKVNLQLETFLGNRAVFEEAAKTTGLTPLVSALAKTEYATVLTQGLASYDEKGAVTSFDLLLDKDYYEKLASAYLELPRSERGYAEFYVKTQTAAYLLPMILRAKNLGYAVSTLRAILPDQPLSLPASTLEDLVMASDFNMALNIILQTPFGQYFTKGKTPEETIANAQIAFKKALVTHAARSRVFEVFNVGLVLSFLVLKQTEVANLVAVAVGVEAKLPSEDVGRSLLLPS